MNTTKLYQQNTYIKEWDAVITGISATEQKNEYLVTLDRTAFFPEGGGQSCDTGIMGDFSVTDVQERDGEVYHTISSDKGSVPNVGDSLKCALNWDRRFDNMQRHCGEHILSGIFYSLFGGVNRGFHMGHDYMTIDISLEADHNVTEITYADALKAEAKANEVIWSDAPVTVMRFDSREEAEKMPLRKALAFDEDISIVSVGSVENAADCVACCGTHPSSAGQVGLIKIYKVEKYKTMFRIYFEAGQRALKDFDFKHNMLTDMAVKHSSSIEDLPKKLAAQEEKLAAVKDELFHIKKALTENECSKLDELLQTADDSPILYRLEHFSTDDAFNMGKHYMGNCSRLIMLYAAKSTSYVLVSDGSVNCGSLVKEYASFYNGKGGGNKVSARAMFSSEEDARLFAELIMKHLR